MSDQDTPNVENNYPVVLVSGFLGWGPEEMFGYRYFGGFNDVVEALGQTGVSAFVAAPGPFCSAWDQACELYAIILGGTVDYGAAHSAYYGHQRLGATYPGLLPSCGTAGIGDSRQKVHLVGHSLAGLSTRTLVQLLSEGSEEERRATSPNELSPLFRGGGYNFVHSVTTIGTPHNGTTLMDMIGIFEMHIRRSVSFLATVTSFGPRLLFNFKLGHWGLEMQSGESTTQYLQRILDSAIWSENRDLCASDVSIEGARRLNQWVNAQKETFYFSYANQTTSPLPIIGWHVPTFSTRSELFKTSTKLGCRTPGRDIANGSSWWPNDGVVNTVSMIGPTLDSGDKIQDCSLQPEPGAWTFCGTTTGMDHWSSIGVGTCRDVRPWYLSIVDRLRLLRA